MSIVPSSLLRRRRARLAKKSRNQSFRLGVERLEERSLLATFAEVATNLNLNFDVANTSADIVSAGTSYSLTLTGDTWVGTDSANVTGNGTALLTVTTAGLAAFNAVNITDSVAGSAVNFNNSGANAYTDNFDVTLDDAAADAISFNGASTFNGNLTATVAGPIVDNAGATLVVTNNASFSGTSITLDNAASNTYGTLTFKSAGAVIIVENNGTDLSGTSTADSLSLVSAGAVTDTAANSLTVTNGASFSGTSFSLTNNVADVLNVGGNASFTASGGGSINVLSSGTANFGSLTVNTAGSVDITEDSATDLVGTNTADGMTVTSAGAITDGVASGASITSTNGSTFNGTSISLADNAADLLSFSSFASFFASGGGNITVAAAGTANFGSLNFNSTGTVNISEDSATSLISFNSAGNLTVNSAGAITDLPGAQLTVTNAAILSGTSVSLTDNATDALSIGGNATFTASSSGSITLAAPGTANFNSLTFNTTGAVSVDEDSGTNLSGISTANSLILTSGGNISETGSLSVTNATTFTTTVANSDILLDTGANDFAGAVNITNNGNVRDLKLRNVNAGATVPTLPTDLRDLTLIFNNAAVALPAVTLTGALSVTADGTITDTGALIVPGITTLNAGAANDITLNNANDFGGAVSTVLGLNVTLVDTTAIILGASTISGTLDVTAGGNISETGILSVSNAATFTATAATSDILLDTAANDFAAAVNITNNGNVRDFKLRNVNAGATVPTLAAGLRDLTLIFNNAAIALPAVTLTGALSVTAGGSITDLGTVTVGTTGSFTTLNNNDDIDLGTLAITGAIDVHTAGTTGNANIVNATKVDLAVSTVNGNLAAKATTGDLVDSGLVTVTGTAGFTTTAAGATINLDQLAVTGALDVHTNGANSDATLKNATAVDLATSAVGGKLTATATTGNMTDSGIATVLGAGSFTTSAANATIDLNQLAVTGSLDVNTNGANADATIVNATAVDLATSAVGRKLTATATTGNMTDSGIATVGGAGSFTTSASNATIDLNQLAVTGSLDVHTNGANADATIVNATAVDLATSAVGRKLTATATTGNMTDTGIATVGGAGSFTTSASNATIDLNQLAVTGSLDVNTNGANADATIVNATAVDLATSAVGRKLTATATTGNMTDSGIATVGGAGSFTTSASNATIDLNQLAVTGSLDVHTNGANADATIVNATAVDLATSAVGRKLTATATTGNMTDTGIATVGGAGSFTTSASNATIDLNQLAVTGSLDVNTNGANADATIVNAISVDLATSGVGRKLTATATTGNMTDSGIATVGGGGSFTTSASNATINLDLLKVTGTMDVHTNGATATATIINAGAIDWGVSDIGATFDGTANGGAITQSGKIIAAGPLVMKTKLDAGAPITLINAANDVPSINLLSLKDNGTDLTAGEIQFGSAVGYDVVAVKTTANARLWSDAAVTETDGINDGIVLANGFKLRGTGSFALGSPTNNVATLAGDVGGNITYNDVDDLTIGSVVTVDTTSPTPATETTDGLKSGGGNLGVTSGMNQTVIKNVRTSGTGTIQLEASLADINAAKLDVQANVTTFADDDITLGTGKIDLKAGLQIDVGNAHSVNTKGALEIATKSDLATFINITGTTGIVGGDGGVTITTNAGNDEVAVDGKRLKTDNNFTADLGGGADTHILTTTTTQLDIGSYNILQTATPLIQSAIPTNGLNRVMKLTYVGDGSGHNAQLDGMISGVVDATHTRLVTFDGTIDGKFDLLNGLIIQSNQTALPPGQTNKIQVVDFDTPSDAVFPLQDGGADPARILFKSDVNNPSRANFVLILGAKDSPNFIQVLGGPTKAIIIGGDKDDVIDNRVHIQDPLFPLDPTKTIVKIDPVTQKVVSPNIDDLILGGGGLDTIFAGAGSDLVFPDGRLNANGTFDSSLAGVSGDVAFGGDGIDSVVAVGTDNLNEFENIFALNSTFDVITWFTGSFKSNSSELDLQAQLFDVLTYMKGFNQFLNLKTIPVNFVTGDPLGATPPPPPTHLDSPGVNVLASVVNGQLQIIGSTDPNQIQIELGATGKNTVRLSPVAGSGTTINGSAGVVDIAGVTKGLDVKLGVGNDVIAIKGTKVAGPITLDGGNGNDTYLFDTKSAKLVVNDTSGVDQFNFAASDKGVKVNLAKQTGQSQSIGNGNSLKINGQIENIIGSAFNDTLTGNAANNVIQGGTGADKLNGGGGFDLLIGGAGKDTLTGNKLSSSILIGGTTQFDFNIASSDAVNAANDTALLSILAEWSSAAAINTRVGNLTAGGGLNGANVLTLGGTVAEDNAVDTLTIAKRTTGTTGNFLFPGIGDKVKGKTLDDRP